MFKKRGFDTFGLSSLILKAIGEKGYQHPTPIQDKTIPVVLSGQDLLAIAQTGTGKTACFTLPILNRIALNDANTSGDMSCLILVPTRELAIQILDALNLYGQYLSVSSTVIFGGVNSKPQISKLKQGVDVLVATPGRLLDLYRQGFISFSKVRTLVLDEADRMLDMGFIHDMKQIISLLPKFRQTLFFSATFSSDIERLATSFLNDPVHITVARKNKPAAQVKQSVYFVEQSKKSALLYSLIDSQANLQVLVFSRTKHRANKLTRYLEKQGIKVAAIHGNKSQSARITALSNFKSGKINVLVATDIASRGLDIEQLPQVINFDLPSVPEDYVHRIGRTGRAGCHGEAISLVSPDEKKQLKGIERLTNVRLTRASIQPN